MFLKHDPNHDIDEDYKRIDKICDKRINAIDFGEPKKEVHGYFIVAAFFLFVAAIIVNKLYGAS